MRKSILYIPTLLLLLSLFSVSCKKDGVTAGVPTITRVSTTLDQHANLESGELNQWLVIWGNNLNNTQSVQFNDLTVEHELIYSNDTMISVKVPRQIPGTVNDKITVTTPVGTATYDFTIVIPQLSVTGFKFDYPVAGDTLEIIGSNFDLYGFVANDTKVGFAGNKEAPVVVAAAESLKVIVPDGAEPGSLTITPPAGSSVTTKAWYKDNRNILFDMNAFPGWNGSGFISSGPSPATFGVPYFKIAKSWDGGWAWAPFVSGNVTIPQEIVDNPAKLNEYVLRFEMNIAAGSPAIPQPLNIVFQGNGFKDAFFNPSPSGSLPFNTNGKWVTISAPMSLFEGYPFLSTTILEIMLKYSNPFQSDFAITNFRIVPK